MLLESKFMNAILVTRKSAFLVTIIPPNYLKRGKLVLFLSIIFTFSTGRCGEWANCFALIASAMGFDVRYCTLLFNRKVHLDIFTM